METGLQIMRTTKADRLNELVGLEIESKLKIIGPRSIHEVAEVIFNMLQNSVGRYGIAPSMPVIRPSKTLARHYGYQSRKGKIKKAFTITERALDGLLQIKRKGRKTFYHKNIMSTVEQIEPLTWTQWTAEVETAVIHQEVKSLGGKVAPEQIFLVAGLTERNKLKIRVINKDNHRVYTIGVDETTAPNGKILRQIEIEYIGLEPAVGMLPFVRETQATAFGLLELEIVGEIKVIEHMVIGACDQAGIRLKPTRKTKFKWLRGM